MIKLNDKLYMYQKFVEQRLLKHFHNFQLHLHWNRESQISHGSCQGSQKQADADTER